MAAGIAASSSCSRCSLSCNLFSASLRSVMSRAIFETPITRPVRSRIGEIVREKSIRLPSLLRRMVDALPGPYLGQDLRLLVLPVGRNQEHDSPADNLI